MLKRFAAVCFITKGKRDRFLQTASIGLSFYANRYEASIGSLPLSGNCDTFTNVQSHSFCHTPMQSHCRSLSVWPHHGQCPPETSAVNPTALSTIIYRNKEWYIWGKHLLCLNELSAQHKPAKAAPSATADPSTPPATAGDSIFRPVFGRIFSLF